MKILKVKKGRMFFSIILTISIFGFGGCEKANDYQKVDESNSFLELRSTSIDATYIGEMHNVFVLRAYKDYLPYVQNDDGVLLDIIALIDYFASQPEAFDLDTNNLLSIKEFYMNFETDSSSNLSYVEQLNNYLVSSIEERDNLQYDDIINGVLSDNVTQEMIDVASEVSEKSTQLWSNFASNSKADGSATIAADTGGALWGLFFGPVGSIIAGGVASIVANEIENADGNSPVFDGHIHTPKDI